MKAGVIGRAIGGVDKLALVLQDFTPGAVLDKYAGNWEAILKDIVELPAYAGASCHCLACAAKASA